MPVSALSANRSTAPVVYLAPMAGITDLPFRDLVGRFGADLVVSEMVASQELVQGRSGVDGKSALGIGRSRTAVQIAGREAYWMAEAARRIENAGAERIDINMGCPAKKVVTGLSGSALMRDPDHALTLIDAVVGAVGVPVTLKMRLGWDDANLNACVIARRAEAAGIRSIAVHGRTRCQFYRGGADWAAIGQVKRAVTIPVIANGDILSAGDARKALAASGADGVMVGRGARGRPWLLAQIGADLRGNPPPPPPSAKVLAALILDHVEASCSFYGRSLGARVIRKHLGWYLDAAAPDTPLRRDLLTADGPEAMASILPDVLTARELAA